MCYTASNSFVIIIAVRRRMGSYMPSPASFIAGRDAVGHHKNEIITSSPGSEKVVHGINIFIASSLAFGCRVGCHRHIFDAGLLFLSTSILANLFFISYRSRSAGSGFLILLSASRVGVSIPLDTLDRALITSPFESSDIGCMYPDPRVSIESPGNSPGKSYVLGC